MIPNNIYSIGQTIPKTYPGGCQSALISSLEYFVKPKYVKGIDKIILEKDISKFFKLISDIINNIIYIF